MALNQIALLLLLLFPHFYSPFATVFQLASESTLHYTKETSTSESEDRLGSSQP